MQNSENTLPDVQFLEIPQNSLNFFEDINRGGLKVPSDILFTLLGCAYVAFCKIKSSKHFLTSFINANSSASLFCNIVIEALRNCDSFNFILDAKCPCNHCFLPLAQKCLYTFFNILAKKYVKEFSSKNIEQTKAKVAKLRSTRVK